MSVVACSANGGYSSVPLSCSFFEPVSSVLRPGCLKSQRQLVLCYADETNPQLSCFHNKKQGKFLFWACVFSTKCCLFPSQWKSTTGNTSVLFQLKSDPPLPVAQQLGEDLERTAVQVSGTANVLRGRRREFWRKHGLEKLC